MTRRPTLRELAILGRQADRVAKPPKRRRRIGNRRTKEAAQSARTAMQRALTTAVAEAQAAGDRRAVEAALAHGDVTAATEALGWQTAGEPALRAGHAAAYAKAFNRSALLEAETLGARYSVLNRNALTAMEQAGARFVTEIGEGTRRELRAILTDMLNQGRSVRDTAKLIQDRIGLTQRLSTAVDNFGAKLVDKGWEQARVDRAMARKARELLNYRARLIAQGEAQNAAAAGARASWAEAAVQGLLDVEVAEAEWVTTSDPCPKVCADMDGQRRKLGEFFETGDGRLVSGPGTEVHPGDLCTVIMHTNRTQAAESA